MSLLQHGVRKEKGLAKVVGELGIGKKKALEQGLLAI